MKAIIMAGGKGTRIASVTTDVPKPMIPVCGIPILQYQIESLRGSGLTDIRLVIGHLGNTIRDFFADGSQFGVHLSYFEETSPLGTAGALFQMDDLDDDFLLLCGDLMLDVDFNRFVDFHRKHKAWASLMTHPNGHPYDSSLIVTEILEPQVEGGLPVDTKRVVRWMNKEEPRMYYKNRVNAGIEMISPKLLQATRERYQRLNQELPVKIDLDRDVLKPLVDEGHIFAYDTTEYIKDMGTPDRYYEVEHDVMAGIVKARNLKQKQRAVFLDRDGTINEYVGFLSSAEQFKLVEGTAEAIRQINKSGYLAIVITNQPVIARGDCTFEQLRQIHDKMETELGKSGAYVDAIYVCPHHPDTGFEGERREYKKVCSCRKPNIGLLLQAEQDFHIDLGRSFIIGDSMRDVEAGRNAGLKDSLLIQKNQEGQLMEAVQTIIKKNEQ